MGKDKLTKQEAKFTKVVAETGNKTLAVKTAFGIKDDNYAGVKGNRLLRKDKIQKAIKSIADSIPDDLLITKHKLLLEQKQLAYFIFSKKIEDDEIADHMKANGLDLIVIRETDKGKMAFYSIFDANAIAKGLDMGYKIKGTYAPVKGITLSLSKPDFKEYE